MSELPPPPYGPEIDAHDAPIPREALARLAVAEFGIDYETALDFANEAADRIERRRSRQVRRAEQRTLHAAARRCLQ